MRAPGEAVRLIALESAIDEMAYACGIDPLAFRLKNYAEAEPISGEPFSSKALRQLLRPSRRTLRAGLAPLLAPPKQMRDEPGMLIGWGVGTATFSRRVCVFEATAKAVLRSNGTGMMEIGAEDMGQGAWTALAQIAADSPGLDLEQIDLQSSGNPTFRMPASRAGSAHTATAGIAIHVLGPRYFPPRPTCDRLIERSPLFGAGNTGVIARGGRLFRRDDETRNERLSTISWTQPAWRRSKGKAKAPMDRVAQSAYSMHSHGAVFAEVKVDPDLGQIRVPASSARSPPARIINPRMVRSQHLRRHDLGHLVRPARAVRHGSAVRPTMNANLAEYHVPVNGRRALGRGDPCRGKRPACERSRHQGRRRNRNYRDRRG